MPPNPFQTAPYPDMLTDLEKNAIRDHYRAISENLPQFRPRAAQREMIAAVANAFARSKPRAEGEEPPKPAEELVEKLAAAKGLDPATGLPLPKKETARRWWNWWD